MVMPDRSWSNSDYRYGYQGSEINKEIYNNGNQYTTEFRQLDPRFGRWFSLDPVFQPHQSPYNSMNGDPINLNDPLGDAPGEYTKTVTNGKEGNHTEAANILASSLDG